MPTPDYIEIPLTHGLTTKVSPHRFEHLNQWTWQALWSKNAQSFYAVRRVRVNGKSQQISMHRYILGLEYSDPRQGDHIKTGDTLNNTDENLRIATRSQQQQNRRTQRNNKSGYKGVFEFYSGHFAAAIWVNRKKIHLGYRKSAKAAYEELYVPAALKYHGEFANLQ